MCIKYQRIKIATPRHNGKAERQHRIDQFPKYAGKNGLHLLVDFDIIYM